MRLKLKCEGVIALILCVSALIAGSIKSGEEHMRKLPAFTTYGCAICHESSNPQSGSKLNQFGLAFEANKGEWNNALAIADSDGDGVDNGRELGDEDGDGELDDGVTGERSNPGDRNDTPSSITERTWSAIKQLLKD